MLVVTYLIKAEREPKDLKGSVKQWMCCNDMGDTAHLLIVV
jgi:hypothetical protein